MEGTLICAVRMPILNTGTNRKEVKMRWTFRFVVQSVVFVLRVGAIVLAAAGVFFVGMMRGSGGRREDDEQTNSAADGFSRSTILGTRESVEYDEDGARVGAATGSRILDD